MQTKSLSNPYAVNCTNPAESILLWLHCVVFHYHLTVRGVYADCLGCLLCLPNILLFGDFWCSWLASYYMHVSEFHLWEDESFKIWIVFIQIIFNLFLFRHNHFPEQIPPPNSCHHHPTDSANAIKRVNGDLLQQLACDLKAVWFTPLCHPNRFIKGPKKMLINSIAFRLKNKLFWGNNKTLKTSSFGIKEILSKLWKLFRESLWRTENRRAAYIQKAQ